MDAAQPFRSLAHSLQIQIPRMFIDISSLKYMRNIPCHHPVTIGLPFCMKSAVKSLRRFFHVDDADILRQIPVHILQDLFAFHFRITVKIRSLP